MLDSANHHPATDEIIQSIHCILPLLEKANVKLAIENHDRFTAGVLLSLIESIDSPFVGVCLDTVNSFGALEGPDVVIETLHPHVLNIHFKDFCIRRETHNMGFRIEGTPLGKGVLDISMLIHRLKMKERGIHGILELWPTPEESLEATILKEHLWLKESASLLLTYQSTFK